MLMKENGEIVTVFVIIILLFTVKLWEYHLFWLISIAPQNDPDFGMKVG